MLLRYYTAHEPKRESLDRSIPISMRYYLVDTHRNLVHKGSIAVEISQQISSPKRGTGKGIKRTVGLIVDFHLLYLAVVQFEEVIQPRKELNLPDKVSWIHHPNTSHFLGFEFFLTRLSTAK